MSVKLINAMQVVVDAKIDEIDRLNSELIAARDEIINYQITVGQSNEQIARLTATLKDAQRDTAIEIKQGIADLANGGRGYWLDEYVQLSAQAIIAAIKERYGI